MIVYPGLPTVTAGDTLIGINSILGGINHDRKYKHNREDIWSCRYDHDRGSVQSLAGWEERR